MLRRSSHGIIRIAYGGSRRGPPREARTVQVTRTDRAVLAFSVLASAYVAFLVLDFYVFKLDWILLGVVRELLTIPLFLAVAAAFVLVVVRLLASRKSANVCNAASALILFALNCFIWGSFVF